MPLADPVLRASLFEQRARLRGPDAPPPVAALLDLELRRVDVPGGAVAVIKPSDWPVLREQLAEQGVDAPYWATVWPSGVALARHLVAREDLDGTRVLELGCGLGVAAAAAARRGAHVLATDGDPDAVAFAAHTLALNEVEGEVALATWPELVERWRDEPFDLVVAADVLYRRQNVDPMARLLAALVAPDGEAVIADPGRTSADELWPVLRRKWRRTIQPGPGEAGVRLHRLRRDR